MGSFLCLGLMFLTMGCATEGRGGRSPRVPDPDVALLPGPSPAVNRATTLSLAGPRCSKGACVCRAVGRNDPEAVPPADGSKRFEIRIAAVGGLASVELSDLGILATPPSPVEIATFESMQSETETCAYIDIPVGSTHDVAFVSKASSPGQGIAPRMSMAEYGPIAKVWYDLIDVACAGPGARPDGRCDRKGAETWTAMARLRKRGRLDPCGSTVVTRLAWETSGGQDERAGGLFRDFTVRFTMEVKKFATQFAPGATECVPK